MSDQATRVDEEIAQSQAQMDWAALSIAQRLKVLRRARFAMSRRALEFTNLISPTLVRTAADTLATEVLPLLAACRFLEGNAARILAVRRLGRRGLPIWLTGLDCEVRRVPFGIVLVIGPANYPLFLPGVQTLQGLAAGNAIVWKPGRGGRAVAELFAEVMVGAGLPKGLLRVTDDSVESALEAFQTRVDKVIFTGSSTSAKSVLRAAAEKMIPCVVEASGCDAVVILPSADIEKVVQALVFGIRLNGSATCMAPRRVLVMRQGVDDKEKRFRMLVDRLSDAIKAVPPIPVSDDIQKRVQELLADAVKNGAVALGEVNDLEMRPILVTHVRPEMEIARADIFAPLLSLFEVEDIAGVRAAQEACPFGLAAAVFGEERDARQVAESLEVGTVFINEVIVSTADPRLPFGGRRQSGFGATRGAEGLLEMTSAKVVAARRGNETRQYQPTGITHEQLFHGLILSSHSPTWRSRWQGLKQMVLAAKSLGRR